MPFRLDAQRDRIRPPEDASGRLASDQVKDGEAAVMQVQGQIRLWTTGGVWYARDAYQNGAPVAITNTYYDPPKRIRLMSTSGAQLDGQTTETGYLVEFDMPQATQAIERLIFGSQLAAWVTRVYLPTGGAQITNATSINLYY